MLTRRGRLFRLATRSVTAATVIAILTSPAAGGVAASGFRLTSLLSVNNAGVAMGQIVGTDGDTLVASSIDYAGRNRYLIYVREAAGWVLQAEITPDDTSYCWASQPLAIAGDTIALGNPCYSGPAGDSQGAVHIYVRTAGQWQEQATLTATGATFGAEFGLSLAIDGDTLAVASLGDEALENAGAVYVFVRNGAAWTQQAKLTASDAQAHDYFGRSVDVRSDTIVVGAPGQWGEGRVGRNEGRAYVYERSGTAWTETQILTALDGQPWDNFGYTLAVSGDRLAISAFHRPNAGYSYYGAVYVFTRSAGFWTETDTLVPAGGADWFEFGGALALDGDTLAAAPTGSGCSEVYLFVFDGDDWIQQARLESEQTESAFGMGLALDGDRLAVGAPNWTAYSVGQGAVQIFERSGTVWTLAAELTEASGDLDQEDGFGYALALDGTTAVVGVRLDASPTGPDEGSAYVFVRDGPAWQLQAHLVAPDAMGYYAYFGWAVALDGNTLAIGAPYRQGPGGYGHGVIYVFTRTGQDWSLEQILAATGSDAGGALGASIDLQGDTLVAGAWTYGSTSAPNRGAVYIFTRSGGTWTERTHLTRTGAKAYDVFGYDVSLDGTTLAVGVLGYDGPAGASQGMVQVYTGSGASWNLQQQITPNPAHAYAEFGTAVDLDENTLLVGSPAYNGYSRNQGSAWVFTRSGTTWTQRAQLLPSDPQEGNSFGIAVSLQGNTAVIGDDQSDRTRPGATYVFTCEAGTWTEAIKLNATESTDSDRFGHSVSLDGNLLLVGADHAPVENGMRPGAADVFLLGQDCDGNGIPDVVEPDDDADGVTDACDVCPDTLASVPVDIQGCPPVIPGDADRDGDVDQTDFDSFEICASGPGIPISTGCDKEDFDLDLDVDQSDFAVVQRCLSGEGIPANANCAG
jgi:hypothetical protein